MKNKESGREKTDNEGTSEEKKQREKKKKTPLTFGLTADRNTGNQGKKNQVYTATLSNRNSIQ